MDARLIQCQPFVTKEQDSNHEMKGLGKFNFDSNVTSRIERQLPEKLM